MWEDVIREASDCLKIDPDYMKAALRRAEAYEKTEDYINSVEGKFQIKFITYQYIYTSFQIRHPAYHKF